MEIGTTGLGAVEEPSGASAVVVEDTFDSIALPCDQPGACCACLGSTNTCGGTGLCWKHRHHLSATVVDKVRGPAASFQRASKLCVLLPCAGVVDHMAWSHSLLGLLDGLRIGAVDPAGVNVQGPSAVRGDVGSHGPGEWFSSHADGFMSRF